VITLDRILMETLYFASVMLALHWLLLVCSKLPDTMVGVSEQVNKEVNKTLAERGFPTTKPEQQLLLKGQICAVVEPNNAVYKLMSKWHHLVVSRQKCTAILEIQARYRPEKCKKVKVGFLYSATYMVDQEQRASTISEVAVD